MGVTSMIFALPWLLVVMTPACEPVNDCASAPSDAIAMATNALEIRSPEVSSMSISRGGGAGLTCSARSSSSSVVSPMAETTTTTSSPRRRVSTMRSATRRIRSAVATEDPPYFCTTSANGLRLSSPGDCRALSLPGPWLSVRTHIAATTIAVVANSRPTPRDAADDWAIPVIVFFAIRLIGVGVLARFADLRGTNLPTTLQLWDGKWMLAIARYGYAAVPASNTNANTPVTMGAAAEVPPCLLVQRSPPSSVVVMRNWSLLL